MKSVIYYERGTKYKVYEDGSMSNGNAKLTHRRMNQDEVNRLFSKSKLKSKSKSKSKPKFEFHKDSIYTNDIFKLAAMHRH